MRLTSITAKMVIAVRTVASLPTETRPCRTLSRCIHAQGSAVERGPVELGDRAARGLLRAHLNKRKTFALTRVAVGDDASVHDVAIRTENLRQLRADSRIGSVPYLGARVHWNSFRAGMRSSVARAACHTM